MHPENMTIKPSADGFTMEAVNLDVHGNIQILIRPSIQFTGSVRELDVTSM
jgi:hypothetical protein